MQSGQLPEDWKLENVTPVFKNGQINLPNNYCPISLTSQACKVLESIIRDQMIDFLSDKNIFSIQQHGFTYRNSCFTNLLETFEDWTTSIDLGYNVEVVFLDFKKAFNSVAHQRLLIKLRGYGIANDCLNWISSFLCSRHQRVVVNGKASKWYPVDSGVPQVSVLGPLLFILYVNDIPDLVESKIKMFADDIKIYKQITSFGDALSLQNDLDKLCDWAKEWLLHFNVVKCKHLKYGNNPPPYEYYMNDEGTSTKLGKASSEKDLGVWITSKPNFTLQCDKASAKAMQNDSLVR